MGSIRKIKKRLSNEWSRFLFMMFYEIKKAALRAAFYQKLSLSLIVSRSEHSHE